MIPSQAAPPAPDPAAVFAAVILPFAAAPLAVVAYRVLGNRTAYGCAAVAAACFGLVASQAGTQGTVAVSWVPRLGIAVRLYVDGLALLVAFLASGVGVLIFTYSGGYMRGEPGGAKYYASLLVFMGSMLGLVLAADLVALFLFWELTSLSSFALIGHYQRADESLYAARKSMLITVAGGLFLLVGLLVLYAVSGVALDEPTYNLVTMLDNGPAMRSALRETGLLWPVLGLVGVGAAAKSAQVPLHIWLPNAMEAPTPVSAFLHSATMVKAGVYLVGRFRPLLSTAEWSALFVALGLATMTVTAILAVAASDIKELLAYSTASHLGLITAGFGFAGSLGAETGAFHVLNHAVFKAALFLVAGIVAHEAGTRRIDDLGGLYRDLPVTAVVTAIAALSMAGLPPLNGFYSKELLFEASYHAAETAGGIYWLAPVVAVFGSVFTFLYSVRFLMLFFGDRPDALADAHVHRPPLVMLLPPALLGLIAATIGLVPQAAIDAVVGNAYGATNYAPAGAATHSFTIGLPTKLKPAVVMSAVTIAAGLAAYPFYGRIRAGIRRVLAVGPTTVDWYYDRAVEGLNATSRATVGVVQTGKLRTYATWAVGTVSVLALAGYAATGVVLPAVTGLAPGIDAPIEIVLLLAVGGALAVGVARSHIAGVLVLSIVGFMIAIFYIMVSAPDLALTQLLIETLVLVIFLLVLDQLPAFYGDLDRGRVARDVVVSAAVGATVFVTVLVSTAASPDPNLRQFLVARAGLPGGEHSPLILDFGGGGNAVNVILVDFRAFDTLGEISVVGMAALSVLTLVGMRDWGENA